MKVESLPEHDSPQLTDIFSKPPDNPIMMSITESKSFGSPSFDGNGMGENGMPEITISLSSSSDSLGLNDKCDDLKMKPSFSEYTNDGTDSKKIDSNPTEDASESSSMTKESSTNSNIAHSSNPRAQYAPHSQGHPPSSYHGPPYHGGSRPNGVPPFHPHTGAPIPPPYHHQYYGHPQPHPSYDQRYGGSHHPPFHPGQMMQHPYHQPPGGYPRNFPPYHPHSFYHPGPPPNSGVSNSSVSGNVSSSGSVTSTGSKKRTVSGMMESDTPTSCTQIENSSSYRSHRNDSNSSVGSNATSGENMSSSKLACESPLKRERINEGNTESKRGRILRTESRESSSETSTLSFGGLSVNSYEKGNSL